MAVRLGRPRCAGEQTVGAKARRRACDNCPRNAARSRRWCASRRLIPRLSQNGVRPPMDIEQARFNMVEQQIRTWDVLDQQILDLLFSIRREEFVPAAYRTL